MSIPPTTHYSDLSTDDKVPPTPQIPPLRSDSVARKLAWLESKRELGKSYLTAQPNYSSISKVIDAVMGTDASREYDMRAPTSYTRTNRIAKNLSDRAGMLTDIKPFWEYTVSNRKFEQHASNYSKLATSWYQRRDIDMVIGDMVVYEAVSGVGYFHMYWDSDIDDVNAKALDPRNVIPINPAGVRSLEQCQGYIIDEVFPVAYFEEKYGKKVPPETDGISAGLLRRWTESVGNILSPVVKWGKAGSPAKDIPKIPTAVLHTCYIKDNRCNCPEDLGAEFTDGPIEMGPFYDEHIPDETDPITGMPIPGTARTIRKPGPNWAYLVQVGEPLYPRRRKIVWVGDIELFDGPSEFWHGQFPTTKVCLDPVPFSWFGVTQFPTMLALNTSLNKVLRNIDDHISQVANPGSIHDKNNVSASQYEQFDTRQPGWKIRQNPLVGKGIQVVNPPPLDNSVMEHRDWLINELQVLNGTLDVAPLMNLKQLPSNSTIESIINSLTPTMRRRSRMIESSQRQIAMQFAYNTTQYYTLPVRISILGADGIVQDDFDYDPGSMLPDFPFHSEYDEMGQIKTEAMQRGPQPRYDRAKEFLRGFIFKISPGSLLNAAQMERTLLYFQLARAGVIDPITLLEQLNIPNIGVEALPPDVRTILQRIAWCQMTGLMMNVNAAGRKASGQESPEIKMTES